MPTFAGQMDGAGGTSLFDFDLVEYLSAAIQIQVYAPLRKGNKFRAPLNVDPSNPIVAYSRVHAGREQLLKGPSGLVKAHYQVDVFARIDDDAAIIEEQVRFALQGFSGTMGSTEVLAINLGDQMSAWLENEDPKKVGVYRRISEYTAIYRETIRDFTAG